MTSGLARTSLTESLQLSLATGQRLPVARGLEALAALEARAGDPARAARLAGAALELRSAAGHAAAEPGPGWPTCSARPAGRWASRWPPPCWPRAGR